MTTKVHKIFLLLMLALPVIMSGCNKRPNISHCKKNADCPGGVCHMGKCEECVVSADCASHKPCINHRCETTCHVDADCGATMHCEDNICHKDCGDGIGCSPNRVCTNGRCLSDLKLDPSKLLGCADLSSIHFDFDRYSVSAQAREQVQILAQCLTNNPSIKVLIEGHTDDRGTTAYNIALGEKRALAVKNYLELEKGIASNRIETISYGETKPVVDEKNEHAWYQNRRAEFTLQADG
jgi:peptidoglycan-associated lipoprotein